MDISGGTLNLSNSLFESMTFSILVDSADTVDIKECTFRFVGELHGPYFGLGSFGAYGVVDVSDSGYISLTHSVFGTYTPGGLVVISKVNGAIMNGNQFTIDTDGHITGLYDVDIPALPSGYFNWQWAAVAFKYCGDIEITENVFSVNEVDSTTPWMYLFENKGTSCLSANKFGTVSTYHDASLSLHVSTAK